MLKRLLRFLRPESAGDVLEESADRSRLWLVHQILSALWPSRRPFASWSNDVRYAARSLANNPGFTAIAVAAIALGIGVNTGIFTLLNSVALRPLPVPGAADLVSVYQILHGKMTRSVHGEASLFSTSEYERYRDSNHVFSGMIAYAPFLTATLSGETPREIMGQYASCNYFDVLGERAALGRTFLPQDCSSRNPVVVLSDDLWRTAFGTDPAVVGRIAVLNRRSFSIAGIAPPGFHGTEAPFAAFWVPITTQPVLEEASHLVDNPNMSWLVMMGRTKGGVSLDRVRADLGVIAARIDGEQPGRQTSLSIGTATFASMPEARTIVTGVGAVLLAAVGMVLLIACANVANLLLARAAGRQKEVAIRLSLGATRWRLIRQLMTESLFIAILGGALGFVTAWWSFQAILAVVTAHLPKGVPAFKLDLVPDLRVLGYLLGITLITGIAFGLAPALRASRPDLNSTIKTGGFLRQSLVGVQIAVCMILLISAGLMLRALYRAQTIEPGFEMKGVETVWFDLRSQGYTEPRAIAFQRRLMERIAAIPGVDGVAQGRNAPLSDNHSGGVLTLPGQSQTPQVELNYVSPEYFSMLRIPIVRGRNFSAAENSSGAGVAMVTETSARRLWPGQEPIGKPVIFDGDEFQVVGVTRDTQVSHLGRSNETYIYFPAGPHQQLWQHLLVHCAIPAQNAIRAAVRAVDPDLAVDIAPLEQNLEWWRTPSRMVGILAGSLGALALVLASIGVYGVVSFAVSRRVREIGIRMALGADSLDVKKLVLRQAMRPILIGSAIGIAGCAAVSQVLSSMLFGVSAHDPMAFAGVPVLLVVVAIFASYVPARRATRIDPMTALRHD
jgi:predicted permease